MAHRRHDISDRLWMILQPFLPGQKGMWGGQARDNRRFLNAVFWILRTGAPWRDLPPDFGDWKNPHRRVCRWRDKGIWEQFLERLIAEPDMEWLMIDASHVKVHPHAVGAVGGNEAMGGHKRGLNTKIHLAVDAHGLPLRVLVMAGPVADCPQTEQLLEGFEAEALLGDKAYDTDAVIHEVQRRGMTPILSPKKNRKTQWESARYLYQMRHLVENAFLHLKRWRGIAPISANLFVD